MNDLQNDVTQALGDYLNRHPEEASALALLQAQAREEPATLPLRSNPRGHLTASALLLDGSGERVLLVQHRALGRWLQPGGHLEAGDACLWAAACREAREETGVQALTPLLDRVLDIDSHAIPARPAKGEAAHTHHDFLFAARVSAVQGLYAQVDEVEAVRWFTWAEVEALGHTRLLRAWAKLRAATMAPWPNPFPNSAPS